MQRDALFLVACRNEDIQGFVTATIQEGAEIPFLHKLKVCKISTIVVDASCRREGVGSLLMEHAERWASSQGATEIRLEVMDFNATAQEFYEQQRYVASSHILCKPVTQQGVAGDSD
ncbi:MAG: GNAT family N-acetyltransferase [Acidithiobacillus sp.]